MKRNKSSRTALYDYQKKAVKKISDEFKGRALLADEMGLGKTIQSLHIRKRMHLQSTLVICPASLKINWQREAWLHLGWPSEILESQPPRGWEPSHDLLIINYEILMKWEKALRKINFDLIIIDEAHRIKSPKAKCTKSTQRICGVKGKKQINLNKLPRVIALGGTPLISRPVELWNILNIIRPDTFQSFFPFGQRYCKPRLTRWGWDYRGASHLKELNKLLRTTCMVRRLKSKVLHELPDKSRSVISLPINNPMEYKTAERDFIAWLSRHSPLRATRAKKAQQLVRAGYLKRLAAELKLPSVYEWIDSFLEECDEKLIIFGIHKSILSKLYKRYEDQSVIVHGGISGRDRQISVDRFQRDKNIRIFIGNIRAAGVGISLTQASTVAFCELAWTPGEHTQAEDRPHRIGQTKGVSIYYLVAQETIEVSLCNLLEKKEKTFSATLDGRETPDFDIMQQLMASLKNKKKE